MPRKNKEETRVGFRQLVEEAVRQIPKGQTRSYKEVAVIVGCPKGARAVARIMANNYDLSVPCHRVIKSDGRLGGYNRGGERKKREMLLAEGWVPGN